MGCANGPGPGIEVHGDAIELTPNGDVPAVGDLLRRGLVRAAGAHSALGASLVQRAGFDAVWASSFEISAARCLPDASLLTMTDFLQVAMHMQESCGIPVIADVDTGFGGTMNVARMVLEYERAGILAVCIEDKVFPKMNSFVETEHSLLDADAFCRKLDVAKSVQQRSDFHVMARTEALIDKLGVDEALHRCDRYVDAGADSVLVHSKHATPVEILDFLAGWGARAPVAIVPTTYPDWHAAEAHRAGVSMIIYANQSLRAMVRSVADVLTSIRENGTSVGVEDEIAEVGEIFALQRLDQWLEIER